MDQIHQTKDNGPKIKDLKTKRRYKSIAKDIIKHPEKSVGEIMKDHGYAPATSNHPGLITNKPAFIEILEQAGITDERLTEVANEGLNAQKPVVVDKEIVDYPDHGVRHKYLETLLKVKHHLTPDTQLNIQANDYKVIIED